MENIYDTIINKCLLNIDKNNISFYEFNLKSCITLLKTEIDNYIEYINIKKAKTIIKYNYSLFNALKLYNETEDINDLLNNDEINFYKDLCKFIIFEEYIKFKLLDAYDIINNHLENNKSIKNDDNEEDIYEDEENNEDEDEEEDEN